MSFLVENSAYEVWLRTQCEVVEADLDIKHERMRKNSFIFLRATFFRWARRIEAICPELTTAPAVLSVGDTHVENFGTWRDVEGRLVWGVNDFDDAATIPYVFDLVRLATSAQLAPGSALSDREISEAILSGYSRGVEVPRPTIIELQQNWMRPLVAGADHEFEKFWQEMDGFKAAAPPAATLRRLQETLPTDAKILRFASRTKGGGGLGRPRYVVIASWRGSRIVREVKALVASAWDWAHGRQTTGSRYLDVCAGPFRSPDPFLKVHENSVSRRIAFDSRKLDLEQDEPGAELETDLLEAMASDVASIHAADAGKIEALRQDLSARSPTWLADAVQAANAMVEEDFGEWRGKK